MITIDDVKQKYGVLTHGYYVYCDDCPLMDNDGDCGECNGYEDAWTSILSYLEHQGFTNIKDVDKTKNTDDVEDVVNHPSHYTQGGMECIDEMIMVFGVEAVKHFCLCNVWKYRKRALHKNGQEDLDKADWYLNKYKELSDE